MRALTLTLLAILLYGALGCSKEPTAPPPKVEDIRKGMQKYEKKMKR